MFDNPICSPMICPCIVLGRVLVLCRWAVEKPSSRLKAGRSGPLEMGPELKVDVCIGAVGIEYVCLNLFKPLSGKNLWCARRSSPLKAQNVQDRRKNPRPPAPGGHVLALRTGRFSILSFSQAGSGSTICMPRAPMPTQVIQDSSR